MSGVDKTGAQLTEEEKSFPLAVHHRGFRFEVKSERDAMQLLFTMVRDGICSVEKAMECIQFEDKRNG